MRIDSITGLPENDNNIYYTEEYCTGQGYSQFQDQYRVFMNDGLYYTGLDNVVPVAIATKSIKYTTGECVNDALSANGERVAIHEITLPFTMPISLPMQFE